MANFRALFPAIALAATLHAQLQDPANLAGERVSAPSLADTLPINHGAPALQQLLLKLRTRASLMMIVAHPDDEDGGMLTYESRGLGARVAMLTLTRGEGGQNLMSADFDDALGLIRTQELLAADRYFGVDQMFGTEVDFGFSKTKEETLSKWTHDRVLYDAVRAVRLYRPLVLASVFVGGPTDGHGHHQVAGEICQEVFLAAADPKIFPEMGLPAWAPLKVYARVPFSRVTPEGMYDYATGRTIPTRFHNYVTGVDTTTEPTATVEIHEGERSTNPAMDGDTYIQFARRGLALQKTQIGSGARLAPAGAFDSGYTLMGSRLTTEPATEKSLFDGVDTTLPGVASVAPNAPASVREALRTIDNQIAEAQRIFNPAHLEATVPPLREALRTLDTLIVTSEKSTFSPNQKFNLLHDLRIKRVQLNDALVLAHRLTLTATLVSCWPNSDRRILSTDPFATVSARLQNNGEGTLLVRRVDLDLPVGASSNVHRVTPDRGHPGLASHQGDEFSFQPFYPGGQPPTRPYFNRLNSEQPFYNVADRNFRNAPATPPAISVIAETEDEGVRLFISSLVHAADVPLTAATVQAVTPPVSISINPAVGIVRVGEGSFLVTATVQPYLGYDGSHGSQMCSVAPGPAEHVAEGNLRISAPAGWHVSPESASWRSADGAIPSRVTFTVTPPKLQKGAATTLTAVATYLGRDYTESFRPLGYPGLTSTNFYTPATYRVTAVDVRTAPNLRIAYLPGTGDMVAEYLPNLGITPTILSPKDLTAANLKQYNAVVLGVRAYAAHPSLEGAGSKPLLDYAEQGGIVIVQYMTARYGRAEAPFPITVPGDPSHNVVEEAQPVTILESTNPLLTWPNHISGADFDHWVAERGHGFAATWDPHFTALTETHDLNQDAQRGGLLYARTGKGAYLYVAYALYRQLPEGVPGAYRLFANLLSLGKNPQR